MSEPDANFIAIADRTDMRVILAAELGALGAGKRIISAMDQIVAEEKADVFVQDRPEERIVLVFPEQPGVCFLISEAGFVKMPLGRTQ